MDRVKKKYLISLVNQTSIQKVKLVINQAKWILLLQTSKEKQEPTLMLPLRTEKLVENLKHQ